MPRQRVLCNPQHGLMHAADIGIGVRAVRGRCRVNVRSVISPEFKFIDRYRVGGVVDCIGFEFEVARQVQF
ncbi:hypothetical protein SAMN05216581_3632 [Pseudomonas asplenii]|uniref:Uncharacterized protein n=1 Tax=Pseudomonas asplenii TaxID=53407 RepID=A0A1H6P3C7_9PSED|nr:hypothetical protein SAMN05216581_3632 [Pseudomonas fuscovaginae]